MADHEAQRLQALHQTEILDTTAEEAFDDLTRLAAHVCGTPIALVSFMDADRQWIKSRVGWEGDEIPRHLSWCNQTIAQADLLVIPDTVADDRWVTHPWVMTDSPLRFYAGIPLQAANGQVIGTLSVLDRVPRQLSAEQRESLRAIGRQLNRQLEMRQNLLNLERVNAKRKQAEHTLRNDAERLAAIIATQHAIARAGLDLSAVLNLAVECAHKLTCATGAMVLLTQDDELICRAASQRAAAWMGREVAVSADDLLGECLHTGKILCCDDVQAEDCVSLPLYQQLNIQALMVVPLHYHHRTMGILLVFAAEKAAFSDRDIDTLRLMAGLIAAAISYATEFAAKQSALDALQSSEEQLRRSRDELESRVQERTQALSQANETLRIQQDFLRKVIDTSPSRIFVKDAMGRFTLVNQAFAASYGKTVEELIGQLDTDFHPVPEEIERFQQHDQLVLSSLETIWAQEIPITNAQGEQGWFQSIKAPLLSADGQVTQILGIATEVTERKLANAALQKAKDELEIRVQERTAELSASNQQLTIQIAERQRAEAALRHQTRILQSVLDSMGDGVIVVNADDAFFLANPAAEDILRLNQTMSHRDKGWRAEHGLYLPDKVTPYPPDDMPIARAMRGEAMDATEVFMRHPNAPDGIWLSMTARPLQWENAPRGGVAVFRDITTKKQAEEEIQRALQRERELSELKTRFVAMVSHEFRTPLSTILLYAELLENFGHKWEVEKQRNHFKKIRTAISKMTRLLDDVLTIGRSEAGKLNFEPGLVDLPHFCHELIEEVQLGVGRQAAIAFTHTPDCQQMISDEKLLRQILLNLLSNAVKYSIAGGVVQFDLHREQNTVVFRIQDQGIGIPLEDQPHLFNSFHRAKNAGEIPGTGLGLAIVKRCVEAHGGQITFSSQESIGTTFIVTLPTNHS